jgi:hypothetical protein
VQRGRHVAEVVYAHIRRGCQTQPAHRERSAAGRWSRRRHGPLRLRFRHGREISGEILLSWPCWLSRLENSAFHSFSLLIVCACEAQRGRLLLTVM